MAPTATAKKKRVTIISKDDIIAMMKAEQGDRSLRSLAKKLGVSPGYISEIYSGGRNPGEAVLDYFDIGLTRNYIVEYVYFLKK
jgi:transcriptional regulator with XRE-family HTH domain